MLITCDSEIDQYLSKIIICVRNRCSLCKKLQQNQKGRIGRHIYSQMFFKIGERRNIFSYFRKNVRSQVFCSPKCVYLFPLKSEDQKHPPEAFYQKRCPQKFLKIHRTTTVSESPLKKILYHRCFPVNFAKLRTPFTQNTSGPLFLEKIEYASYQSASPQPTSLY